MLLVQKPGSRQTAAALLLGLLPPAGALLRALRRVVAWQLIPLTSCPQRGPRLLLLLHASVQLLCSPSGMTTSPFESSCFIF